MYEVKNAWHSIIVLFSCSNFRNNLNSAPRPPCLLEMEIVASRSENVATHNLLHINFLSAINVLT